MPFDEPEQQVFGALDRALGGFRSALAATIERLRADREEDDARSAGAGTRASNELGSFAVGRIDLERFEAVSARERVAVEPQVKPRLAQAFDTLAQLGAQKEQLYRVNVEPGGSLHHGVQAALAQVGRAFGAARVADLSRTGRYREEEHAAWLTGFPFARWSAVERRLAPPLVVRVDGADLRAECLAEFLDGRLKIVLLVRGECPPAPLTRLITPGVFVAQVSGADELAAFAAFEGPGVAALVPEGAARFTHDPGAGDTPAARLQVRSLPESSPDRPRGGQSVFQQTEPLRQLSALVAASSPAAGPAAASEDDPVGKLAGWLLRQADLKGLE